MGGLFFIEMKFNSDYPEKGPIDVQMRTPTYHPNIFYQTGHILVLIIVEGISIYSSSGSSSLHFIYRIFLKIIILH